MKAIENRHYRSLELDKILEMLASHATCADAKSLALSLTPQTDLYLAQALLKQTEDAHMLLARFGGPAFGGLHNVNRLCSVQPRVECSPCANCLRLPRCCA